MTVANRGVARSVRLFRSFRVEQSDPARFYGDLARDSLAILAEHTPLQGATLLDVGAGPAEFAAVFTASGARYLPLDRDRDVPSLTDGGVVASAERLPFADGSLDIVFSSNLLEHVPAPMDVASEMVRVLRPGGVLFLSYTNWLSPWGGHETSPYHWISGAYAARRYARRHGHRAKNVLGDNVFKVSVAEGVQWAHAREDVEILAVRPRYWPDSGRLLVQVPGVREVLTWNLLILLRKR